MVIAIGGFLKRLGVDPTASNSALINTESSGRQSLAIQGSGSESDIYDPHSFPISDNVQAEYFDHYELAVLSANMYNDEFSPCGFRLKSLHEVDDQNPVRWAIVEEVKDNSRVYVVFKGTSSLVDGVVDANFMPDKHECGLQVAGGMLLALKQHVFKNLPTGVDVVLCGHSLGGAYAIITALELLWRGVNVLSVVTFGAPQVIKPDASLQIFERLTSVSSLYVNAWDIVPRLPSCQTWLDAMPSWAGASKAWFAVKTKGGIQDRVKEVLRHGKDYDVAGTLYFVKKGSAAMEKVAFSKCRGQHREKLEYVPHGIDKTFLFRAPLECHPISEYCEILASQRQ